MLVKDKEYFIITTNADGQFEKVGFEQNNEYYNFLEKAKNKNLVLLEIGVGFNTPGIIRFPFEKIAYENSQTTLIRINKDYPQTMLDISTKSILFDENTNLIINNLGEV